MSKPFRTSDFLSPAQTQREGCEGRGPIKACPEPERHRRTLAAGGATLPDDRDFRASYAVSPNGSASSWESFAASEQLRVRVPSPRLTAYRVHLEQVLIDRGNLAAPKQ